MQPNDWRYTVCGIALASFGAGGLMTACLAHIEPARADANRIFELRVYHAVPGKLPVMQSRFRDTTSKLLAKHDLHAVGYWSTEDSPGWDNTFVFLLAHHTRQDAERNWDAMRTDPEFQRVIKSEQAEKTLERADVFYMCPTDFSPMK